MSFVRSFALLLACILACHALNAQHSRKNFQMEQMINRMLVDYPLSQQNMFRLAVYAELKGMYEPSKHALSLDFAGLGKLHVYERSCILKTADSRLYFLNKGQNLDSHVQAFNQRVHEMLDRIFLFANHSQQEEKIHFVDTHLAKKNIEPYEKIFLRHILLKYGRYNQQYQRVEFHTDWLPKQGYGSFSRSAQTASRKPSNPLWIKLDKDILRGYFIRSGGTVYVENVEREVFYATGEDYSYNVSAFKSFLYKMLSQTTQFVVGREKYRLQDNDQDVYVATVSLPSYGRSRGASPQLPVADLQQGQLYRKSDWIPMMLGILRSQNINIGDADIIPYFVDEPYFGTLYEQLLQPERQKVDEYLRRKR